MVPDDFHVLGQGAPDYDNLDSLDSVINTTNI